MKNPLTHAFAAALYIVVIVFTVDAVVTESREETILVPMVMLSLLVLSVAVMGFLFFAEPLRLFMDNKRREAVVFFGKTLAAFAGCVAIFIIALLYFI
jgi:hypothetical protein